MAAAAAAAAAAAVAAAEEAAEDAGEAAVWDREAEFAFLEARCGRVAGGVAAPVPIVPDTVGWSPWFLKACGIVNSLENEAEWVSTQPLGAVTSAAGSGPASSSFRQPSLLADGASAAECFAASSASG